MIYYSHINEDSRIERTLLQQGHFPTIIAICGSGERVISLMDEIAVKNIHVVDNNKEAIYLLQLKIAALTHLPVDDYLDFIGHSTFNYTNKLQLFQSFAHTLPTEARLYWRKHQSFIQRGVLYTGHFERFLQRVRPLTNAWLGRNFQTIFDTPQLTNPKVNWRWHLLKIIFSYKLVYWLAGNRDTAFVGKRAAIERIPAALDHTIKSRKAAASFIAHLIFKGHLLAMQEEDLPPSLQRIVLQTIKDRLLKKELAITYHFADLLDYVSQHQANVQTPVFYSLSDILSFANFDYLNKVICKIAHQEACITVRSFLRNCLTVYQLAALQQFGQVAMHDDKDSTNLYQVCTLQIAKSPCL